MIGVGFSLRRTSINLVVAFTVCILAATHGQALAQGVGLDRFGIAELYNDRPNGWSFFANWTGSPRTVLSGGWDPVQPGLNGQPGVQARGDGWLEMPGDGTMLFHGIAPDYAPRLFIYDQSRTRPWQGALEITVYRLRPPGQDTTTTGLVVGVGSHESSDTDPCNTATVYARLLDELKRAVFQREVVYHTVFSVNEPKDAQGSDNTVDWGPDGMFPVGKWVGMKYTIIPMDSSTVQYSMYRDLTDGANGGSWELVAAYTDHGVWPLAPDNPGFDPKATCGQPPAWLTRLFTEPGMSVMLRDDNVHSPVVYKKLSVREIVPWHAVDIAAGIDNKTRLLCEDPTGAVTVWSVDNTGARSAVGRVYGPYGDWAPIAIAAGSSDGLTRVLWNYTDGTSGVWVMAPDNTLISSYSYGPYPGWTALDLAVDTDNQARILWTNTNGAVAVWSVNNSGAFTPGPGYGPYPGWTARSIAAGSDGITRILWNNTDGRMAIWLMSSDNLYQASYGYGPYPGWTAADLAVGIDNQARILWTNVDGRVAFWSINGAGGYTSGNTYGPYSAWIASHIAAGGDGVTRVLWNRPDGATGVWLLGLNNIYQTSFGYGPY